MSPPASRLTCRSTNATRRLAQLVILGCAGLSAAGCASIPQRAVVPAPHPLPDALVAYYDYPDHASQAVQLPLEETRQFRVSLVRCPFSPPADLAVTEPIVEWEWYESTRAGRRPAIVLNPILGGDYPIEQSLARFFAARGYHVALIHRKTLKISPEHELAHIELLLRQGLIRIRQVVDWVSRHPSVDPQHLGSFGISMGGIAGAMTAAIEPRLRAHVIALAGGPLADILATTADPLLAKPRARYLASHQLPLQMLHDELARVIVSDPIRLAPYTQGQPILFVIALTDRTIGRSHEFALWRALGRPQVTMLLSGHYTSYLALPYLKRKSLRFFRQTLGE